MNENKDTEEIVVPDIVEKPDFFDINNDGGTINDSQETIDFLTDDGEIDERDTTAEIQDIVQKAIADKDLTISKFNLNTKDINEEFEAIKTLMLENVASAKALSEITLKMAELMPQPIIISQAEDAIKTLNVTIDKYVSMYKKLGVENERKLKGWKLKLDLEVQQKNQNGVGIDDVLELEDASGARVMFQ